MIEINEIVGFSIKEIVDLLRTEEHSIEIYFPKHTKQFFSTNLDIADEYLTLAYVGQKIRSKYQSFNYDIVPPNVQASVLFEIETEDLNDITDLLFYLANTVFVGDDSEGISQFLDDIENGRVEPACPEFIDYYLEFIDLSNQDSDED